MTSILIAEDEDRIASFLRKGLAAAGFSTATAGTGPDALALASTGQFDLVVLDLGLPGLDGHEVVRRLREHRSQVPVIILTARSSADDALTSLQSGANDYMPKPFRFDELLARVRLRLGDARRGGEDGLAAPGILLNLKSRRVTVGDRDIDLSAREFALAEEFLRHPDQVLSREQLLSRVWGYDFDPGSNVVDVYVGYLRAKLGPGRITTVRGMGYRFT